MAGLPALLQAFILKALSLPPFVLYVISSDHGFHLLFYLYFLCFRSRVISLCFIIPSISAFLSYMFNTPFLFINSFNFQINYVVFISSSYLHLASSLHLIFQRLLVVPFFSFCLFLMFGPGQQFYVEIHHVYHPFL